MRPTLFDGMPNGARGAAAMDGNGSWGTLYWGGARFWLLADLEIRQRTKGKKSVQDALRGINANGGDGKVQLQLEQMLALGDSATGTTVLRDLHARLGVKGEATDLDALWKQLGVDKRDGEVIFDDAAPLAAIRRAMTRSSTPPLEAR